MKVWTGIVTRAFDDALEAGNTLSDIRRTLPERILREASSEGVGIALPPSEPLGELRTALEARGAPREPEGL